MRSKLSDKDRIHRS